MKNLVLLLVGLCAGGLVPVQGSINARLSEGLNHPLQATFISFFGALILLVVLLAVLNPALPSRSQLSAIPPVYYTGGIYGVLFVTTLLVLTPHIGIASTVTATIVGQLILSVILDHFGLFGLARHPIGLSRLLGSAGLLVSLYLIQKG